jgi:hypothetical protein
MQGLRNLLSGSQFPASAGQAQAGNQEAAAGNFFAGQ